MTLKDKLYNTIHKNKKPLKAIAEEIDVSENYLTRAALPDPEEAETGSGCRFPLKKLIPLILATGDFQVLDFIEASLGRVAIPVRPSKASCRDLYKLALKATKEFGEMIVEAERGLKHEQRTMTERQRIHKEGYDAVQAILTFLEAVK
jgi:hypothetical protein